MPVQEIPLRSLVFHERLQCRESMCEETIARYSEAMRKGATFPRIRVVLVDGVRYVVDGWHRAHAAERAELKTIRAKIEPGTWLDAVKAAAGANEEHGLQRSREARRNGILLCLMEEELCTLSSRDVAEIAHTSHTNVNNVRKEYGVPRGTVLTPERRAMVEDEPSPAWAALASPNCYYYADLLKLRFMGVEQLMGQVRKMHLERGIKLRLEELGTEPWPWPEDTDKDARLARAESVDTAADIGAVICAKVCPLDRWGLLKLLRVVQAPKRVSEYDLERLTERHAKRPAVVEALRPFLEQHRDKLAKSPDVLARRWLNGEAVDVSAPETLRAIRCRVRAHPLMLPALREAVRVHALGEPVDCPMPDCSGWVVPKGPDYAWKRCTACDHEYGYALSRIKQARELAAALAREEASEVGQLDSDLVEQLDGEPVEEGDGDLVEVEDGDGDLVEQLDGDRGAVATLRPGPASFQGDDVRTGMQRGAVLIALAQAAQHPEFWTWVDQGPAIVGIALDGWLSRPGTDESSEQAAK